MKFPLTLLIIAQNEENNIERCIRSVPFATEVLVVDSGSRDRTVEIAQSLGARVLHKEWAGFGPQKKWGTEQAQFDWVLSLDADEALSPELVSEITQKLTTLVPEVGYEMPRKSFHLGRWIRFGGWYPDYQLRLYHRRHSQWPEDRIHERVRAPRVERLNGELQHFVFVDLSHQVRTNDRYSSLLAERDYANGKRFSVLSLLLKPPVKFLECYILKRGFLDGVPGLIIAVGAAHSIFLRKAKLWELQVQTEKRS